MISAVAPDDPATARVIKGHLDLHHVSGEDSDLAPAAHPAGGPGNHLGTLIGDDQEGGVAQHRFHDAFGTECLFVSHSLYSS